MKFVIFALVAFFAKLAAADDAAAVLDLHALGFKLYGRHKPSGQAAATGCPLGTLPDNVFLHKSVKHGDHFFTWVKPVHGLVKEVKCAAHAVWKGADHEFLVDFHFFGLANGVKLVHLEHLTALGGVAHAFLKFEGTAAGVVLGLAKFVVAVADLMKREFLNVKALPASGLLHELALHFA